MSVLIDDGCKGLFGSKEVGAQAVDELNVRFLGGRSADDRGAAIHDIPNLHQRLVAYEIWTFAHDVERMSFIMTSICQDRGL